MKKVFIKYDPYKMQTKVVVDGKEIQNNKHCDSNLKRYLDADVHLPIQVWIDPIERDNWRGLLETLCQMGDKDIVIEFSGRKIDYESVQEAFHAQNEMRQLGATLTFCDLLEEIAPDTEMKKNIETVINLMLNDKFEEIVRESKSKALRRKYDCLKQTYEEIEAEAFRIVFTGTYSSGKSSTINALIGKSLLPTATGTCTAKNCKVIHDVSIENLATVRYEYKGILKEYPCTTEQEVQDRIKAVEDAVTEIEVYTDLSALYPDGVETDFKLVLIDTPGTDSAVGNDTQKFDEDEKRLSGKSHVEMTKEVLGSKQKEMVVLISDEKFEDENIVDLLNIIEESADQDEGNFNNRFLFVMNMCDTLSYSNEGENLSNYVKNFITNIKKIPNAKRVRNIVNPRVFPIASGVALAVVNGYTSQPGMKESNHKKELYKYYENFCRSIYYYSTDVLEREFDNYIGQIKSEHSDYKNYCLEMQSSVSEATKYKFAQRLNGKLSIADRVMIHSGLPSLQNAIQEYIKGYAYPIKMRRLLDCFTDILVELDALNRTKHEVLQQAKKSYESAVSARTEKETETLLTTQEKEFLESKGVKLNEIKERISQISETIPEINRIRSNFQQIRHDITGELAGKTEMSKEHGDRMIQKILNRLDRMSAEIDSVVRYVKLQKQKATNDLHEKFLSYIKELEKEGLLQNGSFSLRDTVEFKQLINKDSFKEAKEDVHSVKNPNKYRIEFGTDVGNFFHSIGRAWKTRSQPDMVQKTTINVEKWFAENIPPMEEEVDRGIQQLRTDYAHDIMLLKENATDKVQLVYSLIVNKNEEIATMEQEAKKVASDEKLYAQQIEKIENSQSHVQLLISKIGYTQV